MESIPVETAYSKVSPTGLAGPNSSAAHYTIQSHRKGSRRFLSLIPLSKYQVFKYLFFLSRGKLLARFQREEHQEGLFVSKLPCKALVMTDRIAAINTKKLYRQLKRILSTSSITLHHPVSNHLLLQLWLSRYLIISHRYHEMKVLLVAISRSKSVTSRKFKKFQVINKVLFEIKASR